MITLLFTEISVLQAPSRGYQTFPKTDLLLLGHRVPRTLCGRSHRRCPLYPLQLCFELLLVYF